jgi:hypothetical protein
MNGELRIAILNIYAVDGGSLQFEESLFEHQQRKKSRTSVPVFVTQCSSIESAPGHSGIRILFFRPTTECFTNKLQPHQRKEQETARKRRDAISALATRSPLQMCSFRKSAPRISGAHLILLSASVHSTQVELCRVTNGFIRLYSIFSCFIYFPADHFGYEVNTQYYQ